MRNAYLIEITPAGKPAYFLVGMAGFGDLCRRFEADQAEAAIAYQRELNR